MSAGEVEEEGFDAFLLLVGLVVGAGDGGFVALDFDVVVVAHELFPPDDAFFGFFDVAGEEELWDFAAEAC